MNLPARVKRLEARANPPEPERLIVTVLRFGEDTPLREPIHSTTTDGRPLTIGFGRVGSQMTVELNSSETRSKCGNASGG